MEVISDDGTTAGTVVQRLDKVEIRDAAGGCVTFKAAEAVIIAGAIVRLAAIARRNAPTRSAI
jgi:hypothetical protein